MRSPVFFAFLLFFVSACGEKIAPPPGQEPGDVVFYADLQLNNEGVRLAASGEQAYVLEVDRYWEDSFLVSSVKFSEHWCLDRCGPSLEMRFYTHELFVSGASFPEPVLSFDTFNLAGSAALPIDDYVFYHLSVNSNLLDIYPADDFHWSFGSVLPDQVGTEVSFWLPDTLTERVCLSLAPAPAFLLAQNCGTLLNGAKGCAIEVQATLDSVGWLLEAFNAGTVFPNNLLWSTGDTSLSIYYSDTLGLPVCVEVDGSLSGCTASACVSPLSNNQGFSDFTVLNWDVESEFVQVPARPVVELVYTDVSGKVYYSSFAAQPADALFEILSYAPYAGPSEWEEPIAYRFSWRAENVLLRSEDGAEVYLTLGSGVLGL